MCHNDSYESAQTIFRALHEERVSLSTLYLTDNCPESDEGAAVFADMLRHNTTIETLNIDLYSFVVLSMIVEALGTNYESALQKLHVCFSEMDDEARLKVECQRLAALLPRVQHLESLTICAHD